MGSVYGQLAYGKGQYSRAPYVDFVGDLPVVISWEGQLDASSLLHGNLNVNISSGITATFSNPVDFHGRLDIGAILLAGDPYRLSSLSGTLGAEVTFAGAPVMSGKYDLIGAIPFSVAFGQPRITFIHDIEGDLPVLITIGGDGEMGPLWEEDAPCPVEPWVESELCPG